MNRIAILAFLPLLPLTTLVACSDDDPDPIAPAPGDGFVCSSDTNDWEQCQDGKVQWCHTDHFHWGMDCAGAGLTCVEHGDHEASCVDPGSTCSSGEHKCEDNTAYNCIAGSWGQEPCGSKTCHDHADEAHCEEGGDGGSGGGHSLPEEACEEFAQGTPEHVSAVTDFASFEDCHMDLDTPIHLDVPDGQTSYCHFPVTETGEYVIFLGTASAFVTIHHRTDGAIDPTPTDAGPNSYCATALVEHYHADLEMDGTSPPVPYVLELAPSAGGGEVELIVKRH